MHLDLTPLQDILLPTAPTSLILDRSESLYMKISNWKCYGRGPRFPAINLQPPQDAPSVSKKEGTFPTIGIKIDWVS